jgi:SNF2 family DNA or RNA helicase
MYSREIEKQLIGRIHRIGREKPVKVFRLITKDTVEEEIYRMF